MNGKGDKRRPGNGYSDGWDRIYKKREARYMKYLFLIWELFKVSAVIGLGIFVIKLVGLS